MRGGGYASYTTRDWLSLLWNPADGPLWFIRDLWIVHLCMLPLYYIIRNRYIGAVFIIFLLYQWIRFGWIFGIMAYDSFLFFSIGGYLMLQGGDITKYKNQLATPLVIVYAIGLTVESILWARMSCFAAFIEKILIIVGMVAMVSMAAIIVEKGKYKSLFKFEKYSFFVYASHGIPLVILMRAWSYMIRNSEYWLLFTYFAFPIITVLFLIGVFRLMEKWTPRFLFVLNGNRRYA